MLSMPTLLSYTETYRAMLQNTLRHCLYKYLNIELMTNFIQHWVQSDCFLMNIESGITGMQAQL